MLYYPIVFFQMKSYIIVIVDFVVSYPNVWNIYQDRGYHSIINHSCTDNCVSNVSEDVIQALTPTNAYLFFKKISAAYFCCSLRVTGYTKIIFLLPLPVLYYKILISLTVFERIITFVFFMFVLDLHL